MKKHLCAGLALLLVGCSTMTRSSAPVKEVTNTRINIELPSSNGVKRVTIENPKDTKFDKFHIDPATGEVELTGYKSVVSEAAISAAENDAKARIESTREIMGMLREFSGTLKQAGQDYMRMQGIPVPSSQSTPTQPLYIPNNPPMSLPTQPLYIPNNPPFFLPTNNFVPSQTLVWTNANTTNVTSRAFVPAVGHPVTNDNFSVTIRPRGPHYTVYKTNADGSVVVSKWGALINEPDPLEVSGK